MPGPRYPDICIQLSGEDGNIGAIMARCVRALKDGGATQELIDDFRAELLSGTYEDGLRTVMRWFDVS